MFPVVAGCTGNRTVVWSDAWRCCQTRLAAASVGTKTVMAPVCFGLQSETGRCCFATGLTEIGLAETRCAANSNKTGEPIKSISIASLLLKGRLDLKCQSKALCVTTKLIVLTIQPKIFTFVNKNTSKLRTCLFFLLTITFILKLHYITLLHIISYFPTLLGTVGSKSLAFLTVWWQNVAYRTAAPCLSPLEKVVSSTLHSWAWSAGRVKTPELK